MICAYDLALRAVAGVAVLALAASAPACAQQNQDPSREPTEAEAAAFVKANRTGDMPRRDRIPPMFMLTFTDPGCNPGQDCDDVGPWRSIRRAYFDQSGCNQSAYGIGWGDTEPAPPRDGKHTYDFSRVKPDAWTLSKEHVICNLDNLSCGWANEMQFSDKREQWRKELEAWAEAACRFAREKYGTTLFMTGGNERDLVAKETYKGQYPDWYQYYMDPILPIYRGMKKANPGNRLIIGNFCYTDRAHVSCIYLAGGKGHFDILAVHPYGPRGANVDVEQLVEAHQELEAHGDGHIPLLLTEGWSSLPLPESLEKDARWRGGTRPYTPEEIEHYRQSVLDGWRNLMRPKPGYYDPNWLTGAHYFVLNDHWGGRGWEKRAKPKYGADGKLEGFHLDGYFIGTTDPNYVKPILRPWGLIDIEGKPKGDTVFGFPPYIPAHTFSASLAEKLSQTWYDPNQKHWLTDEVKAGKTYRTTVRFRNNEKTPMTQCRWSLSERSEKDDPGGYAFAFVQGALQTKRAPVDEHLVRAKVVGASGPEEVKPGQTVTLTYDITFDGNLDQREGSRKRVRPICDLYYVWEGRPYHTDAWLPRVVVDAGKS